MTELRRFPGSVESVRAARRFVHDAVGRVPDPVYDALSCVVSELATNAVLHAASGFTVAVDRRSDSARVAVTDEGSGSPVPQDPGPTETHGRGLRIVAELADHWGVEPVTAGRGKTVWFEIDLDDSLHRSGGR